MLKSEDRRFEVGFLSDRNVKHEIQVTFNGLHINGKPNAIILNNFFKLFILNIATIGSPYIVEHDWSVSDTSENSNQYSPTDYMVVEGGPMEGLQCGEKMWIILDAQTAPYNDIEFKVTGLFSFLLRSEIR